MRLQTALLLSVFPAGQGLATEPFGGTPRRIPGVVEAEDFDEGEAEAAYHDVTEANQGADYRGRTQVDIERRADASNGHGIGWTRAGEWLVYTVEVVAPGPYTLEIPVASAKAGGRFHIEFDGKDVTGPIAVLDTGAWTKLETIRVDRVHVPAGKAVMKVVMDADGQSMSIGDIDCFRFLRPRDPPAAPRTP
jgi:chitinase